MITPGVSVSPTIPVYVGPGRPRERRPLSELRYLQSDMNYTWLVWSNGERMLVPRSLGYFLAQLPVGAFVRIHRQYVVNRRCVAKIEGGVADGRMACLNTGERLPISRRQWVSVRARLLKITHSDRE